MIVLCREIMMLWLRAGYGEMGAGAPNSGVSSGGGGGGGLQGWPRFDKGGGGSNNYLFFKR